MSENSQSTNTEVGGDPCRYLAPHQRPGSFNEITDQCHCLPALDRNECYCSGLSRHWSRPWQKGLVRKASPIGLIAYVRSETDGAQVARQIEMIEKYCTEHGYHISRAFKDIGSPAVGLQEALDALQEADGLIAINISRFVGHHEDPRLDLRPFVHHFFCHSSKHLITVEDGIDTRSPAGQMVAVELVKEISGQ